MTVIRCLCGERLSGEGPRALTATLREHARTAHADFPLSEARLEEIVAAALRATPWDGERVSLPGPLQILPLAPGRASEFLDFFDRDAFADNPLWAACYCMYHHFPGDSRAWGQRSELENRIEKAELIRSGRARGWLARAGERTVGWCHAAARAELPGVAREPALPEDDGSVGSIVCFVVAAAFRGQGVARRLLEAACDGLRSQGLRVAEAYPRRTVRSDADSFHGSLEMYLAAGFELVRDSGRALVVRRTL